jgi:hypothetical protein
MKFMTAVISSAAGWVKSMSARSESLPRIVSGSRRSAWMSVAVPVPAIRSAAWASTTGSWST